MREPATRRDIGAVADPAKGRALLAQRLDAPDDAAARLVYADWLEEQGHPAATLVRTDLPRKQLHVLLQKYGWFVELDSWISAMARESPFDRGMLRTIWGPARPYATKQIQAALLPLVSMFGAAETIVYDKASKLASCETLAWTTSLWWKSSGADDDICADLAASPHLARLIHFQLDDAPCTNAGLEKLARSKHLGRLRQLTLIGSGYIAKYDQRGVLALLDALAIDTLSIPAHQGFVDTGVFGDTAAAAKLVKLVATAEAPQATRVLRGRAMTSLRHLTLALIHTPPDADFEAFLDNPTYARLERCAIEYPSYEPIGAAVLAKLRARFGDAIKAR